MFLISNGFEGEKLCNRSPLRAAQSPYSILSAFVLFCEGRHECVNCLFEWISNSEIVETGASYELLI